MKKLLKHTISSLFAAKNPCLPENQSTAQESLHLEIDGERLMILGFFNRGNVGDEAFIAPYKLLFPQKVLSFHSIDDVDNIPAETAAVIIAGGDVINRYFSEKVSELLVPYKGPAYAFSVGIPYLSEAHQAEIYDHVVIRTKQDVEELGSVIGDKNVSCLPDITWLLKRQLQPVKPRPENRPLTFGICLAQPYFYGNEKEDQLVDRVVKFIYALMNTYKNCRINLLSFNTSVYEAESDHVINDKVHSKLLNYETVVKCINASLHDPVAMLNFIGEHDLIIGMRYHSILFAIMQNVKFVAMYTSKKIKNMLKDYDVSEYGMELPNTYESKYCPVSLDHDQLLSLVSKRLKNELSPIHENLDQFSLIKSIVDRKIKKQLRVKSFVSSTTDDVLKKCVSMVQSYLNIDEKTLQEWDEGKVQTKALLKKANKESTDLARLVCFGITNKIGSPYVWGLSENMMKNDFTITESIKWIHEDFVSASNAEQKNHIYYPEVHVERNIVIDVNYMCQDNYQGLHRSGWSYVISGLQHLDGRNLGKPSQIVVDTCLERTFLWGLDVTKTSNIVPYRQPWTGFVHHTFDTEYSKFNCETLIETKEFVDSLPACKCIYVLSDYLAGMMQKALTEKGFGHVPVLSICHPTEIVPNTFDMSKFLSNPQRKVVNIGAWLRDPYSIYALPVPSNNRIGISKYTLKGKEMSNYFAPSFLFDKLFDFLIDYSNIVGDGSAQLSRPDDVISSIIMDVVHNNEPALCRSVQNKYISGMISQYISDQNSVQILENLTNVEYDDLLSQNIVFLNFVSEPSASNTVIEAIVRNTPLIVNRFSALEEVLGKNYPGFYDSGNLFQAASMIIDLNHIFVIHEYMKTIDKSRFHLNHFLTDFQKKLGAVL